MAHTQVNFQAFQNFILMSFSLIVNLNDVPLVKKKVSLIIRYIILNNNSNYNKMIEIKCM